MSIDRIQPVIKPVPFSTHTDAPAGGPHNPQAFTCSRPASKSDIHSRDRATASAPCPVCSSGSKGCSATTDGMHICRGTPTYGWVQVWSRADGWAGYRREDDRREYRPRATSTTAGSPAAKKLTPTRTNWRGNAESFTRNLTPALRAELARRLGVPVDATHALPLLGYRREPVRIEDGVGVAPSYWTLPEYDATGNVVGIERRYRREEVPAGEPDKKQMPGGARGLGLPDGWRDRPGPVLCVEGQSDLMACHASGLCVVSRPGNAAGIDLLAELFRDLPRDRAIIIVGENDTKVSGEWPGRAGAVLVATALAERLDRSVQWSLPPAGVKDSREYLRDPSDDWQETPWHERGEEMLRHLTAAAVTVQPPGKLDLRDLGGGRGPYCSDCDTFGCGFPLAYGRHDCGPRPLAKIAETAGETAVTKSSTSNTVVDDFVTASLLSKLIGERPAAYCPHAHREGLEGYSSTSTFGAVALLRCGCWKCDPCRDYDRWEIKNDNLPIVATHATHIFAGTTEQWNRVRVRLTKAKVLYATYAVSDGTKRTTILAVDPDSPPVPDAISEVRPVSRVQAVVAFAEAVDSLPDHLPKGTRKFSPSHNWKLLTPAATWEDVREDIAEEKAEAAAVKEMTPEQRQEHKAAKKEAKVQAKLAAGGIIWRRVKDVPLIDVEDVVKVLDSYDVAFTRRKLTGSAVLDSVVWEVPIDSDHIEAIRKAIYELNLVLPVGRSGEHPGPVLQALLA